MAESAEKANDVTESVSASKDVAAPEVTVVKATPEATDEKATPEKVTPATNNSEADAEVAAAEPTETPNASNDVTDSNEVQANGSETSGLERKIICQLEYYFGDANLARDKFLLEQISKDDNGWVPLSVLLTFKRLASLSTDEEVIMNAISKSDEGLVEISEDRQKLRRHPEHPIPEQNEERRKEIMSRTAYAKGFPLDTDMSQLIDFFAPYEKVTNITMRKYLEKPTKSYKFKGSVFVTFDKREQTQEFVEKDKVVYKERELLRKWQEKYIEEKREELKNKQVKKNKKQQVKEEEDKFELPKGTVVLFENATDVVTRELVREAIDKLPGEWEVAYLDYSKGEKTGHIRFAQENIAAKFLEKLEEKKLKLNDEVDLSLRLLTDEEEQKFLADAITQMKNRRNNQNKHKYGNRKRRGGGGGGDRHDHKKQRSSNQ